jgi:hypothetical protein
MNMTNKFSSLIGSLIIAFAITLFLPATVNAKGHSSCNTGKNSHGSHGSYGKGSHGSHGSYGNATTNCNDYKTLAYRYLNAYYKCYNYTYYQYYVYFIKKYNQCKADTPVVTNCDKYKDLAQRYLDAYNKCGNSCYYQYYVYYMKKYNNCQANTVQTGKVCGLVFEDTDGNGVQDAGEANYAGAKVTITDVNGKAVTVTTDAQGKYCKDGIEEGEATIEVDLNSLPAGATITTENPTTINVEAGKNNQAGKDGFEPAVLIGNICGQVIVDGDDQANVSLVITDASGIEHIVTTNNRGKWCVNNIPVGDVIVDVNETTLPDNVKRVTGTDKDMFTILADETADAGIDGYETTPTGTVCGFIFEDVDKDQFYNVGEPGMSDITVNVTDSTDNTLSGVSDATGHYCISGVAEGTADVKIDQSTLPSGSIETTYRDPSTVTVIANTNNDAGSDGYYNPNTGLGSIHGTIFCDSNNNGIYDGTDTRLDHITVTITDAEGNVYVAETGSEGFHSEEGTYHVAVKPGEATIVIDVNDPDLPSTCNVVGIGYNPDYTDVVAGQISYAGGYGFKQQ